MNLRKPIKKAAKKTVTVAKKVYKRLATDNHSKNYTRIGNQVYKKKK